MNSYKNYCLNINLLKLVVICIISFGAFSCSKEENIITPTETNFAQKYNINLFSTDTINGYEIKLFTKSHLKTGYNKMYYTVSKNGIQSIKNSEFKLEMKMMMHSHSCPIDSNKLEEFGLMSNTFVIVMPGNDDEKWKLNLNLVLSDNTTLNLEKELDIRKLGQMKMFKIDSVPYFISEADFSEYKTGKNDINFKLTYKIDDFNWANANDLSLEIKPWMGSMGHGSPNNEHPTLVGNGLYKGKINFTMSGDWEIQYKIMKNGIMILESKFDYILN